MTAGARSSFVTESLSGAVAQEYGLTTKDPTKISDQLRQTWTDDEPYGPLNEFGQPGRGLAWPSGTSTGDGRARRGVPGPRDRRRGRPDPPVRLPARRLPLPRLDLPRAGRPVPHDHRGEPGRDRRSGAARLHLRQVRRPAPRRPLPQRRLRAAARSRSAASRPAPSSTCTTGARGWTQAQPAEYSAALRQRTIALLVDAGGSPAKLRAQLLSVNAHTDGDYTVDPPVPRDRLAGPARRQQPARAHGRRHLHVADRPGALRLGGPAAQCGWLRDRWIRATPWP